MANCRKKICKEPLSPKPIRATGPPSKPPNTTLAPPSNHQTQNVDVRVRVRSSSSRAWFTDDVRVPELHQRWSAAPARSTRPRSPGGARWRSRDYPWRHTPYIGGEERGVWDRTTRRREVRDRRLAPPRFPRRLFCRRSWLAWRKARQRVLASAVGDLKAC